MIYINLFSQVSIIKLKIQKTEAPISVFLLQYSIEMNR